MPILDYLSSIPGVQIFFADFDLLPGDFIGQRIIGQITVSDIFLLFFSESAKQSNYVQQEIGVARGHNKVIVPILLDDTKPTAMISEIRYLDLSKQENYLYELGRLHNFILQSVQIKNQGKIFGLIGLLGAIGIGYLALTSNQDDNYDDDEDEDY